MLFLIILIPSPKPTVMQNCCLSYSSYKIPRVSAGNFQPHARPHIYDDTKHIPHKYYPLFVGYYPKHSPTMGQRHDINLLLVDTLWPWQFIIKWRMQGNLNILNF